MGVWWLSKTSSALDVNLAEGEIWQKSPKPRRVSRICMQGGAAAVDAAVDVYFGAEKVMAIKNLRTGTTDMTLEWFWHTSKLILPPGVPINIIVTDAFSATATKIGIDVQEVVA